MNRRTICRRLFAILIAAALLAGLGVSALAAEDGAQNAELFEDISAYREEGNFTSPTKEGKVFGGWYTNEALTKPLGKTKLAGPAYAKWVDENVLSVKWQITADATTASEKTDLRMLTTVDSLEYDKVGFHSDMYGKVEGGMEFSCSKVYKRIKSSENGEVVAHDPTVFSAESTYFAVYRLNNIKNSYFEQIMTVTPWWETRDGTKVTGVPKEIRILDACAEAPTVQVGDTFTSQQMAPGEGENGTTAMDICYTTDGSTLNLFEGYDPAVNSGRWWYSDGILRAFVDPFAGHALLGSSNAAYVVFGYKIPASGKISMKNILLPNSGVNGKALICKNSLSSIKAILDFSAENTYVNELSVAKDDVIYVWYRTPNAPDDSQNAFFTYYCEYTYTALGDFEDDPDIPDDEQPASQTVEPGDTFYAARMAPASAAENSTGIMTVYYDDGTLTPFATFDPANHNGRWYHYNGSAITSFIDPFVIVSDNYGWIGTVSAEKVVMGYRMPASGTINLFNWVALHCGVDVLVSIAKGNVGNVIDTLPVSGGQDFIGTRTTSVDVEKDETIYVIYELTEASNDPNTSYFGYTTQFTYTEVSGSGAEDTPIAEIDDGVLKILEIGNSFTVDTLEYVQKLAHSAGRQDVVLAKAVIGGSSISDHAGNAAANRAAYEFGRSTEEGGWYTQYGLTLQSALRAENWDLVILQQQSAQAGNADSYSRLDELLTFIRRNVHADTQLGFNMTWSYQHDYTAQEFAQFNYDPMTMYESIASVTQQVLVPHPEISFILPTGTAIQNARSSYLGDTITKDGLHMNEREGRYTAALAFVKQVLEIEPESTGYVPAGVSALYRQVAAEAVHNMILTPFAVTQSAFTEPDPDAGYEQTIRFCDLCGEENGANGLTFYYTEDGQTLIPYTLYDETQGRWYDNTDGQLNMFDPLEAAENNYGIGQCSSVRSVAMGYRAPKTGELDLFLLTAVQGPAGAYSYTVKVAVGAPENIVCSYLLEGKPGCSQEERYTLSVEQGQEIYLIYENHTGGGWFGYRNTVTYRTALQEA